MQGLPQPFNQWKSVLQPMINSIMRPFSSVVKIWIVTQLNDIEILFQIRNLAIFKSEFDFYQNLSPIRIEENVSTGL